ncbi:hypothetical protein NBRC116494_32820 [Aurantivibrio plasticivorans]
MNKVTLLLSKKHFIAVWCVVVALLWLPIQGSACCGDFPLEGLEAFERVGANEVVRLDTPGQCEILQPGASNQRYPVLLWSGAAGLSQESYVQGLTHIATYGFVVAIAPTMSNSRPDLLLACVDEVTNYSDRADLSQIAVAGHSIGASSAIGAGIDSRVTTVLAVEPLLNENSGHLPSWHSTQQGPLLLLLGERDSIATIDMSEPLFEDANVPVFSVADAYATHFEPFRDLGVFKPMMTGWLRYVFYNDQNARDLFVLPERVICNEEDLSCEVKGDFQ